MTKQDSDMVKRLKSFAWRLGVVMLVAGVNYVVEQVASVGLSQEWVVFVGLIGGEITKYLNNHR